MKIERTYQVVIVTFICFGIYFFLDEMYFKSLRENLSVYIKSLGISHMAAYFIVGVPIFLGTLLLHGRKKIVHGLGLDGPLLKALRFSILCTLPMFLGFFFFFEWSHEISFNNMAIMVLAAGFFEELYFRSFLFGQLFRFTKLGFIPSVILGALLFGLLHLYQATDITELIGIFLVTFLGGILFAWVYAEWKYNLWVPVFLHMLMNLSWEVFSVSDNALGGVVSNVFRVVTIILIIVLTIVWKKKRNLPLTVNRKNIWRRRTVPSS